jgi:hypothetical protein
LLFVLGENIPRRLIDWLHGQRWRPRMFDDLAGRAVPHSFAGRVDVAREVSTSAQILVRADEVIE